jgi:plastocyanin
LLVNAKAFGTAAKLLVGQVQVSTFQSDNLTVLHMQDAAGVSVSLVTDSLKPPLPIKDVIAEHQGNLAGVAQVDRVSFVRAASVVQKAAAKKAQVELAFNQSEITLSAGTTLRSVDADTTASVSGKVNPALLAKAVRACTGKTIQVELFTNGDKAGVAIVSDENSRHVILSLQ